MVFASDRKGETILRLPIKIMVCADSAGKKGHKKQLEKEDCVDMSEKGLDGKCIVKMP